VLDETAAAEAFTPSDYASRADVIPVQSAPGLAKRQSPATWHRSLIQMNQAQQESSSPGNPRHRSLIQMNQVDEYGNLGDLPEVA
jgi:hypothetical protein